MSQQQEHLQQEPQQTGGVWPSLVSYKEAASVILADKLTETRPLRAKLNNYAIAAWQRYVELMSKHPLPTTFISALILFSTVPIIVFLCVLGVSLGFLVGTAAIVIIFIQSVIACIAGAILLVVLGAIFVCTTFFFFWIAAGVMAHRVSKHLLSQMRDGTAKPGPQLGYEDGANNTVPHSPGSNSSRGSFEDVDHGSNHGISYKKEDGSQSSNKGPSIVRSEDAVVPNKP